MPVDCKQCPEHGALANEVDHISEDLRESKETMKDVLNQISELKTEILKLESREKIMLGIFALAGTVLSSIGSIIGCFITAYIK